MEDFVIIEDFIDFNYTGYTFSTESLSRAQYDILKAKLEADQVNHMYRFDGCRFFTIENCDLFDVEFEPNEKGFYTSPPPENCKLVDLIYDSEREVFYFDPAEVQKVDLDIWGGAHEN